MNGTYHLLIAIRSASILLVNHTNKIVETITEKKYAGQGMFVANSQQLSNTLFSNVSTMGFLPGTLIMDFMSTIMENIFKS